MHHWTQPLTWFTGLLVAAATATTAADLKPLVFDCDCATSWYEPRAEHFRDWYNADERNKREQRWNDYWEWVEQFYSPSAFRRIATGNDGWTADAKALHECAGSVPQELRRLVNDVGWYIAAEWSKDNGVRRISSDDLKSWGARLEKACPGGLAAALKEMRWLRDEVAKRLPEAVQ